MQMNQLKPASSLALKFGVKAMLFGPPGSGKTPLINTAPRPLLLATEPGLLSMRNSNIPTWDAYTTARIDEFFAWFTKSAEAKNFDTLAIDSGSQLAEISLSDALEKRKDGRKAYGDMSQYCMGHFDDLFFMPNKHIVLICKMSREEVGKQVVAQGNAFAVEMTYQSQPYFPGQDLKVKVPHRYDEILYLNEAVVPGQGPKPVRAIRTKGTPEIMARDRSGKLAELEPPDLAALFAKVMQ